jgi:hypothetical protein
MAKYSFPPRAIGRVSHARVEASYALLPLQFTNADHADGVVEWIAIRLTVDERPEQSLLLSPVAEVDMEHFIQTRRKLERENTLEPFTGFALQGRRSGRPSSSCSTMPSATAPSRSSCARDATRSSSSIRIA